MTDIHPGDPFGRYRIFEEVGRGGMGIVYEAWDTQLKRMVALKRMTLSEKDDPSAVQRFLREARAAAGLRHPAIVSVHDVGRFEDRYYLTMDYIFGKTYRMHLDETRDLRRLGQKSGYARLRAELEWLAQVADAVECAHEHGIIHRDLKSANILIGSKGGAYATDFGLAKRIQLQRGQAAPDTVEAAGAAREAEVASHEDSALTLAGEVVGTPEYMSPEQAEGKPEKVGKAADLYALGAILYETLTGKTPFGGLSVTKMVTAILQQEPVPPSLLNRHCPRELELICLKCLAGNPSNRYARASDVAAELRRWLNGRPTLVSQASLWRRGVLWFRRRGWVVAAAVTLVAAGALIVSLVRPSEDEDQHGAAIEEYRERAESLEQRILAGLRRDAKDLLEDALQWRRAGYRDRMRSRLQKLAGKIEEALEQAPELAEVYYHQGRMLRSEERNREAFQAQERALSLDGSFAPARYERAVLLSFQYAERAAQVANQLYLEWLQGQGPGSNPTLWKEPTVERLEQRDFTLASLHERIERDILQLRSELSQPPEDVESEPSPREPAVPQVTEAWGNRLEGILWTLTGREQEGCQRLREAIREDALAQEAHSALGQALLRAGEWEQAAECFRGAIEVDKGYLDHYLELGEALLRQGEARAAEGGSPLPAFREADETLAACLAMEPRHEEAWADRCWLSLRAAQGAWQRGEAHEEILEATRQHAEELLSINPRSARGHNYRALALKMLGDEKQERGEDPTEQYEEAVKGFESALSLQRGYVGALNNVGLVFTSWGDYKKRIDEDPRDEYLRAIRTFERALILYPPKGEVANNRAVAFLKLGEYLQEIGEDPREQYDRAERSFGRAVELGYGAAHLTRAMLRRRRGKYAEAIADLEAWARADPTQAAWAQRQVGELRGLLGQGVWGGLLAEAAQRIAGGNYSIARSLYESALAQLEDPAHESVPETVGLWIGAHYNLACIYSLLADGRTGPKVALSEPLESSLAARHRDTAFTHLQRALELGWTDREHLLHDPDLRPLHDDPRWQELLDALGGED